MFVVSGDSRGLEIGMGQMVAVAAMVGNGQKIHFAKASVREEMRYGQMRPVYRGADVWCGSVRWGSGTSGVVAEIGERVEWIDGDNDDYWFAFVTVYNQANRVAFAEKFGADVCQKCYKASEK